VRGGFSIFIALTISGVLNFAAIALYSRLLAPSEYGAYAVILSTVAMVLGFAFSWVELSFLRFASGADRVEHTNIVSNFATLYAVLLLFVLGLLSIVCWANIFTTVSIIIWLIIMAVIVAEVIFIAVTNHARLIREDLTLYSTSLVARSVLAFSLGWYFVTLDYSYAGIIVASAISFTVPAFVVAFRGHIWRDIRLVSIRYSLLRDIGHFGIPLVLVMVVQSAISATDRFLLVGMLGTEVTGQYAASQDFVVKLFIFLLAIIHKVVYPIVVKEFEDNGIEGAQSQLKLNLTLILAISIPTLFAMAMYTENFIEVILGIEFRAVAVSLVPYQVFIAFINCITMFYLIVPFHLLKKTKLLIVPSLIALLGNLIVGYLAIRAWGVYGAVLGSFVAYSLYFLLSFARGRQFFRLPVPKLDAIKILFSATIMTFILLPFEGQLGLWPLVGLVLTGFVSFTLLSLTLNTGGIREFLSMRLLKVKINDN